jgi:hypothetical protein
MYRNLEKPYHIDYMFASHDLVKNGYTLTFGNPKEWIDKSDHVPMILDINTLTSKTQIQHTFCDFVKRHLQTIDPKTKMKFEMELKIIENFAEKLDLQMPSNQDKQILLDKINTIKMIDALMIKL